MIQAKRRMGCAPSLLDDENVNADNDSPKMMQEFVVDSSNPEEVLNSFIGLDREIGRLEQTSPAPRFGRAVASLKQLKVLQAAFETATAQQHPRNDELAEDEDVEKLFVELGAHKSVAIATEQEEFIANANRAVLQRNRIKIVTKLLRAVEEELEEHSTKVNYLQKLYQHQESLLMNVFGASYGSEKEKNLEQETDTMHNFRDTLAIGVLQWEDGEKQLRNASNLAQRATISWKSLQKQSIGRKLSLAAEARNAIQEAAFLVRRVQDTLPGVQFPYCTERELKFIAQAIEYIFTDILIEERHQHALQVYQNFQQRIDKLQKWINQTLNSSLRKDLKEFDTKLEIISKKLRDERIREICLKLKIPQTDNIDRRSNLTASPLVHSTQNTSMYQRPMKPESRYTKENRYGDVLTPANDINIEGGRSRINLGATLGLSDLNQSSDPLFSDPNLQREFERKLAARRTTLWPSRRMEELRDLTLP